MTDAVTAGDAAAGITGSGGGARMGGEGALREMPRAAIKSSSDGKATTSGPEGSVWTARGWMGCAETSPGGGELSTIAGGGGPGEPLLPAEVYTLPNDDRDSDVPPYRVVIDGGCRMGTGCRAGIEIGCGAETAGSAAPEEEVKGKSTDVAP